MAPLSAGSLTTGYERKVMETRSLSGNSSDVTMMITKSQGNILQCLALVFSTISVASAILAFYWFVRMRRSFRHDLIMLLIQSDMFKALWFMLYPIVTFSVGPVSNSSTFCQVNGFFVSLGIEASDFAVLMIAIHTALYIFRPRSSTGEGGLYPYRHVAYVLWVIFPVLMASLAFINRRHAYVTEGTYCYLPVRPFWYSLALAWVPRYIIFLIILGIYLSIYYYVRYKFHGFNKYSGSNITPSASTGSGNHPTARLKRHTLPPTPNLNSHGLIPSSLSRPAERPNQEELIPKLKTKTGTHRFMWASFTAPNQSPPSPSSETSKEDNDSFTAPVTPHPLPPRCLTVPITPHSLDCIESELPSASRATSWQDGFVRRYSPNISGCTTKKNSVIDMFSMLRQHPDSPDAPPTPLAQLQLLNSRGQNFAEAEMLRTREKIRRQLRFLFIYPLVYIGMWILPFVSHVLQYDDRFAVNPPFGLTCVTTICICSQAAVDCWLFSTREKPWRHVPGSDGSFWASLKFWSDWKGFGGRKVVHGPGKTRDEMVREARAAYKRRDEELAQRRSQADVPGLHSEGVGRKEMSWWDRPGVDGAGLPTVTEEISNPMEYVEVSNSRDSPQNETTRLEGTVDSVPATPNSPPPTEAAEQSASPISEISSSTVHS